MSDTVGSIEQCEATASYLESLLRSLYRALGEIAPRVGDDAIVVTFFESARVLGECAQRLGELRAHRNGLDPGRATWVPIIPAVLERSLELDASGALSVYAFSSLIGSRLLISLRDVAQAATGPGEVALRQRVHEVASVLVNLIQRGGELARGRATFDDPAALANARELDQMLESAHFAESFGLHQ